jgi:thiamine-monophosphate kinase
MRTRTGLFRSETEFVKWLSARMGAKAAGVRIGIGDDAAVAKLARGADLIVKTDMSLEGVHFDPGLHPARSVGHRALARPLSDIAAMGGKPRFALISLAVSRSTSRRWIEEFFHGLVRLGKRFGVAVVGGDTAIASGPIFVDVALMGEMKRGEALLRSGARPRDLIYVSGRLGLSGLGLEALQRKRAVKGVRSRRGPLVGSESDEWAHAIEAHLYPEPRVALGRFLAENHLASAAIDVSDGLSTDLEHLIEASNVGARIWANQVPAPSLSRQQLNPDARRGPAPLHLALHGGEDYELLFTVPARVAARIPPAFRGVPLRRIGEIRRGRWMTLVNAEGHEAPLRAGGFDHFLRGGRR